MCNKDKIIVKMELKLSCVRIWLRKCRVEEVHLICILEFLEVLENII